MRGQVESMLECLFVYAGASGTFLDSPKHLQMRSPLSFQREPRLGSWDAEVQFPWEGHLEKNFEDQMKC